MVGANRRVGLGILFALFLMAFVCGQSRGQEPDSRPSVLFIMIDALRADHCTPYGYARDTTPHLDALGKEGVRFAKAFAPIPITEPSTLTMFTSLYPRTHGVMRNGRRLREDVVTLPEIFAAAGYQTYGIASSYPLSGEHGFGRGFEVYDDAWPVEESSPVEPGTERADVIFTNAAAERDGKYYLRWDRRPQYAADHALAWMSAHRDASRPLFAFVHLMDPHEPTTPPDRYLRMFRDPETPAPRTERERKQYLIDLYDAEVRYTDDAVGRLVEGLRAQIPAENLIVVVVSDHGQGLMQHGWYGHSIHLYEEALRVPLLVSWPEHVDAGHTVKGPVELLDVPPTLLDLAGIDASAYRFQGRSLTGAICQSEKLDREHAVFAQRPYRRSDAAIRMADVPGRKFSVRRWPWKYIASPDAEMYELYNLQSDPGERVNLAADSPNKLEEMEALLKRWQQTHRAAALPEAPTMSDEKREALEALGYVN